MLQAQGCTRGQEWEGMSWSGQGEPRGSLLLGSARTQSGMCLREPHQGAEELG